MKNETLKEIDVIIENKGELVFVVYSMLESIESEIKYYLQKILEKYRKTDLLAPIFSGIKELITNAQKANIKHILINEENYDRADEIEIIGRLKKVLTEKGLIRYASKCKDLHLPVRVYLSHDDDVLTVKIINPVPLNESQYLRIQDKINKARKYDCLATFYMENPDPLAEGMGLGISMVVVLLQGIGVSVDNFQVASDMKTKTTARILIPLLSI